MNRILLVFFLAIFLFPLHAQEVTFHKDIAPIIHSKCTPCHKPGGVAPFKLIEYEDVYKRGKFIAHVTQSRYMPPWHAGPNFGVFKHERKLSPRQVGLIKLWVQNGMEQGDKSHYQPLGDESLSNLMKTETADIVIRMNETYEVPGDLSEQYRFFVVPSRLREDTFVSSIDFVPGNKRMVHHSRIMTDTTHNMRTMDGLSEFDPKVNDYRKTPLVDEFFHGWVPGNFRIKFPPGTGKKIYKDTDFIFNIHYSPTPKPEWDRSEIRLYRTTEKVEREVGTLALDEKYITNQPFEIPPGEVSTFYMKSPFVTHDLSVIGVLPHMHLLGKSFKAYAITPEGDLVKLIHIPSWDFNWQNTYQYKNLVKIPKGSVIYAEAVFDNRAENPQNPFFPPKLVKNGWNTTDEMMNLILYYVPYREGDEELEY